MAENLLNPAWQDIDPGELKYILLERIGKPGQYDGRDANPFTFYLPLAGSSCQVKLTFAANKRITAIEPGPAFDRAVWAKVIADIEKSGSAKFGRDISFSRFQVGATWRGERSGVQILPLPADAPRAPFMIADHPFLLEFPIVESDSGSITNYRRMAEHRRMTYLLNVLLRGSITSLPKRPRHLWVHVRGNEGEFGEIRWVQEFFHADFGQIVVGELSSLDAPMMKEVDPKSYYDLVGHDGRDLEVPSDLDDSIRRYSQLSPADKAKFDRAGYWMTMYSRLWESSFSTAFAALVIAIETLADKTKPQGPSERFRNFIEQHAPGKALERRRKEMYDLRSQILHGDTLMEMDQDSDFGWAPPEQNDKDLLWELWGLTRIALRDWIKNP
jgi:hypothetical protein